jgi:methyltransferase
MSFIWGLAGLIISQRLFELRWAARNRARAVAEGAQEFGAAHYPLFFVLHSGWLAGWIIEAVLRKTGLSRYWYFWLGSFGAAQVLRYWCITSLGPYWNTRILLIPGTKVVRRGPYRFLAHPNYLAVAIELFSVPLIFGAWLTAVVASLLNAALLLGLRIPAENKALRLLLEDSG